MSNETLIALLYPKLKYIVVILIPIVEPQLAGMLGALTYLIVRHELGMARVSFKNIVVVLFFGWLGAWITVNLIGYYFVECPDVWEKIISATIGFLSYDALLALGRNTTSVIGWLVYLTKEVILKWK